MSQFRKKSKVVDAFQWFARDCYRCLGEKGQRGRVRSMGQNAAHEEYFGLVLPCGGQVWLEEGDWVVEDEDYPIKQEVFEEEYESYEPAGAFTV